MDTRTRGYRWDAMHLAFWIGVGIASVFGWHIYTAWLVNADGNKSALHTPHNLSTLAQCQVIEVWLCMRKLPLPAVFALGKDPWVNLFNRMTFDLVYRSHQYAAGLSLEASINTATGGCRIHQNSTNAEYRAAWEVRRTRDMAIDPIEDGKLAADFVDDDV